MALTVETGTGVTNANSYVSLQNVRDYASLRGLTVPVSDSDLEPKIIMATDYVESLAGRYQGSKVYPDARLSWPRYPVTIDGVTLVETVIPFQLINAVCELAVEASSRVLQPSNDGQEIILERVEGAVTTEYARQGGPASPSFPKVDAFLRPLFKTNYIRTLRV